MQQSDLDKISKRLNEAIETGKTRQELTAKFGVDWEGTEVDRLPPDDSADFSAEFTRQMDSLTASPETTVRAFIGNPTIRPIEQVASAELDSELAALDELLYQHQIMIDLLGDVNPRDLYRFITEQLLDYEISNVRIEGMIMHFPYTTPAYEVEMWTKDFVQDLLRKGDYFQNNHHAAQHYDWQNTPVTVEQWNTTIENLWQQMPRFLEFSTENFACQVTGDIASAEITLSFTNPLTGSPHKLPATFKLTPSPLTETYWEVLQTSLFHDLLQLFPTPLPRDWTDPEDPPLKLSDTPPFFPDDYDFDDDLPF